MKPAFKILSPETATEYFIYVVEPEGQPGPWPVVLFMDGDDQFPAAVAAYREAKADRMVPPLLLVGVGYGASYSKAANKRGRDYTQTAHSDEPTSGGAATFLNFVTGTLWTDLSKRYPLDEKRRGIAGHSLGSLFVLYALWQQPLFFTHYLASAPSIWWDNRSILQFAAQRHAKHAGLPARLFLSVGEKRFSFHDWGFVVVGTAIDGETIHGARRHDADFCPA